VTAIDERSIHNVAMQMLNVGAAQFGAAMDQNRQRQEAMPKRPRTGGVGKGKGTPKAARKSKGRRGGRVNASAVAAAVGKDEEKPAVPKPKSAPRRNKVPAAGPPMKKTIVKKVPLEDGDMEGTLKKRRN
jgi:hypothetical protein